MQTFLPYANFTESLKCLDYKRLGKQRVEAMQILNVLSPDYNKKGWINHPAVRMWRGYEEALKLYYNISLEKWISRKYKNNMKFMKIDESKLIYPPWFGNEDFHASHRSNLLRKNYEFYSQYGWTETDDMSYVWPV